MTSSLLDYIPSVGNFLFVTDLRTGSIIIAALGIVHPTLYGFTIFMPLSYLIISIWMLVILFCVVSCVLFYGVLKADPILCEIWVCFTLVFICLMFLLLCMLVAHYSMRKYYNAVVIALCGIVWYTLTLYFAFVVNSYRKFVSAKKLVLDE